MVSKRQSAGTPSTPFKFKYPDISVLLDQCLRGSFYALIFFLPISIALVSTFSGFAIFFYLVKRAHLAIVQGKKGFDAVMYVVSFPDSIIKWPLLSLFVAVLVSLIFSQFPDESMVGLIKVLRGFYLLFSFMDAFQDKKYIQNFIFIWITSAFVAALSGLAQYYLGYDFLRGQPLVSGRVYASMRHANDFGAYIIAVFPITAAMFIYWGWFKKGLNPYQRVNAFIWNNLYIFFAIAGIFLMWALGLTFSRSSWYAFFFSLLGLGIYKKKVFVVMLGVIAVFIYIFTPLMISTRDSSLIADNVTRVGTPAPGNKPMEVSNPVEYVYNKLGSGRWLYWEEALRVFSDYPLWGCGINSYSKVAPTYKISWGGYVHNSYLQMLAEIGVLGLGSFLWLIWLLFYKSFLIQKRSAMGYIKVLSWGALLGLGALLIQSLFDTTFYSVQLSVLLWLLIALVVTLGRFNVPKSTVH